MNKVSTQKIAKKIRKKRLVPTRRRLDSNRRIHKDTKTIGNQPNESINVTNLPVFKQKEYILACSRLYPSLIICGDTACGKTTQIPQFILDDCIIDGKAIAVTQPRRVAATTVASRVAAERGEVIGNTIGYKVRFDEKISASSKLIYMTDGVLLREATVDPLLSNYSFIVLDEVHERTINTDVLIGVLKNAQAVRQLNKDPKKHLKLIVMSATLDFDLLTNYLPNSKRIFIPGREFNVETFYLVNQREDTISSILIHLLNLHEQLPLEQNILVFVAGQSDIQSICSIMQSYNLENLEVLPFYSALPDFRLMKPFLPQMTGIRRIIVSTNLGETSLTIPGIKVVIDSGQVNRKFWKGKLVESLSMCNVSQSEAHQRRGRAGRQSDGVCYRMYTFEDYEKFTIHPQPEIKRSSIGGTILRLVKIGINNPTTFDWLEPPPAKQMSHGKDELFHLKAIESVQEPLVLTSLGDFMSSLPLEPAFGRVLAVACSIPEISVAVIVIISCIVSENLYLNTHDEAAIERRKNLFAEDDLMTYYKILREFRKADNKNRFCDLYQLNIRALKFAEKVKKQLIKIVEKKYGPLQHSVLSDKSEMGSKISELFALSFPYSVAQLDNGKYRTAVGEVGGYGEVKLHPTSVLYAKRPYKVRYLEITEISNGNTLISHLTVDKSKDDYVLS